MSDKPVVSPARKHGSPHAIELALFAVELAEPIAAPVIERLLTSPPKAISTLFPGQKPREVRNFTFTVEHSIHDRTEKKEYKQGGVTGVVWETWVEPEQVELAFHVNSNQILVAIGKYSRWAAEWEKTKSLLSALSDVIHQLELEPPQVASFTLQYNDAFVVSKLSGGWQESLFKKESGYIPLKLLTADDIWHVHQGYVEKVDGDLFLTNIRIDVTRTMEGGRVSMISNHRAQAENFALSLEGIAQLGAVYTRMHSANKCLLSELFCENIQALIGLNMKQEDNEVRHAGS